MTSHNVGNVWSRLRDWCSYIEARDVLWSLAWLAAFQAAIWLLGREV